MIENYISEMEANGRSKYTIKATKQVLTKLNEFKRLDRMTKGDLVEYFKDIKGTDEVKRLHQAKIKKFYTDIGKPDLVDWIKLIKVRDALKSDDILTPDDINKMLDAAEGDYWKFLIAFLFESGCRISEARALKFKDFKETTEGLIVDIPTTKTAAGFRRVLLVLSAGYFRNLKVYTSLPADNQVFHMSESRTLEVLREIGKNAGIDKPVHPHSFRHAQATLMTQQGFNEGIIRAKLGWSRNSPMVSRYTHLNDNSVVEATLKNGGRVPEKLVITEIKQADKITLVDAAMQYSRLAGENRELKERLDRIEKLFMRTMSDDGANEEDIPDNLKPKEWQDRIKAMKQKAPG